MNTVESLYVDTAIQIEGLEIRSRALITGNQGVKEENTFSHFSTFMLLT
jgi:hypothetical protein